MNEDPNVKETVDLEKEAEAGKTTVEAKIAEHETALSKIGIELKKAQESRQAAEKSIQQLAPMALKRQAAIAALKELT